MHDKNLAIFWVFAALQRTRRPFVPVRFEFGNIQHEITVIFPIKIGVKSYTLWIIIVKELHDFINCFFF